MMMTMLLLIMAIVVVVVVDDDDDGGTVVIDVTGTDVDAVVVAFVTVFNTPAVASTGLFFCSNVV